MRLLSELASRVRSLLFRNLENAELEEELRFHLDKDVERRVAAGMSKSEAHRLAQRRLGGLEQVKDRTREARGLRYVDESARNIRHALRRLLSTWGVSLAATLTIAIGVALTATIFSVVYGVLIRPLPFPDSEQLAAVDLTRTDGRPGRPQFEALDLGYLRERQTSFDGIDGYFQRIVSVVDAEGLTEGLTGTFVTASALDRLGIVPVLGRSFRAGEDFTANIQYVVISHDFWMQRYAGDERAIGARIRVDGRDLEVIGVMPDRFSFPGGETLWLPMDFDWPSTDRDSGRSFQVFGRLKDGMSMEGATAEATTIAAAMSEEKPDYSPLGAAVFPLADRFLPNGMTALLRAMLAAVCGVLLIACANVAGLLLAGSLTRRSEVSVKLALGASRRHILLQFLTESLLLSSAGCLLALGLTAASIVALKRWLLRLPLPEWIDISLAAPALLLIGSLVIVVTLGAGMFPGLRLARTDVVRTMGGRSQGSLCRDLRRTGAVLTTAQIAVSCALLIGAGLLVMSIANLRGIDTGYDASRVLSMGLRLPVTEFSEPEVRSEAFAEILRRIEAVPGVDGVSLSRGLPGTGPTFAWEFEIRGNDSGPGGYPEADGMPVTHGYFHTMDIDLLAGRDFTADESQFGNTPAAIVNETLAARHLGPDPIGRQIRIASADGSEPWFTVVGVVEDTHVGSASGGIGMVPTAREQMYLSWGIAPYPFGTLLIGSDQDPMTLAPTLRRIIEDVAPSAPVTAVARLADVIRDSTWAFGLFGTIFTVFGVVALILSAVGLYGIVSFGVDQRKSEMSLRMALGAYSGALVRMILSELGKRLVFGIATGTAIGLIIARSLRSVLFGVGTVDLAVYSIVLLTVVGTGCLAVLLPALRAARASPAASLGS